MNFKMKFVSMVIVSLFVSNAAFAVISSTSAEFFDSTTEGTSSTSNSTKKIFSQNDKDRLEKFVDQNFDRLQEESARGQGVLLTDYVNLVGCDNSRGVVTKAMHDNYGMLFNSGKNQLVNQTEKLINSNSNLARACETKS
ncbi:MAG: DUF3015 family protein [Bdellovibrionota bacterium]